MKRVNFKSILMALAVTLAFLFAGAERGNAQGLSQGIFAPPSGNFLNSDQAKTKLFDNMNTNKQSAESFPQGNPFYNQFYNTAKYYGFIYMRLRDNPNMTVSTAIVEALKDLAMSSDVFSALTPKQLQPLKTQAINLLKN